MSRGGLLGEPGLWTDVDRPSTDVYGPWAGVHRSSTAVYGLVNCALGRVVSVKSGVDSTVSHTDRGNPAGLTGLPGHVRRLVADGASSAPTTARRRASSALAEGRPVIRDRRVDHGSFLHARVRQSPHTRCVIRHDQPFSRDRASGEKRASVPKLTTSAVSGGDLEHCHVHLFGISLTGASSTPPVGHVEGGSTSG